MDVSLPVTPSVAFPKASVEIVAHVSGTVNVDVQKSLPARGLLWQGFLWLRPYNEARCFVHKPANSQSLSKVPFIAL
jgi:hypothetical protein